MRLNRFPIALERAAVRRMRLPGDVALSGPPLVELPISFGSSRMIRRLVKPVRRPFGLALQFAENSDDLGIVEEEVHALNAAGVGGEMERVWFQGCNSTDPRPVRMVNRAAPEVAAGIRFCLSFLPPARSQRSSCSGYGSGSKTTEFRILGFGFDRLPGRIGWRRRTFFL